MYANRVCYDWIPTTTPINHIYFLNSNALFILPFLQFNNRNRKNSPLPKEGAK